MTEPTDEITVTAIILLDNGEDPIDEEGSKTYQATADTLNKARFLAEKKARAFLRRRKLSVSMENVVKERCPDCETKTTFTVHPITWVPPKSATEELKWFLDDYEYTGGKPDA